MDRITVSRRAAALLCLLVLTPTTCLLLRWSDPSLGQIPTGWQMHTKCWGAEDEPKCRP